MENNNAIAAQGPHDEAKIENVKPTADEGSPDKVRGDRGSGRPRGQRYRQDIHPEDETGKWAIRRKIWDYLEDNNLVNAPKPCHYRIPNFEGASEANDKLASLDVFKRAKTVKVNPDKPQEHARFLVLKAGKELVLLNQSQRFLQPSSSSSSQKGNGLLSRIVPPEGADDEKLLHCCTSQGVKECSAEIDLDEKVKIDLLVVGSVAVSRNGYRIGKGKGFADLEYAMMRTLGTIDANTIVVTTVHDSQIVDIPEELVGEHDLTVDYILTPKELIETKCARTRPTGVIWNHLEVNKFYQIPVLKQLRDYERNNGRDVLLKGQENDEDDPLENIEPPRPRRFRRFGRGYRGRGRPYRYRRGGGGRRRDDSNRENAETGDESGGDGDNEGRGGGGGGRRRNYRNRRFQRGSRPRASESEHSDGGEGGQGDGEDKGQQRRYSNRRRYQPRRRRYDGGNRRDNRGGGDQSGSDGEQKISGDEEGEGRRPQRQRFRTNPNAIVWLGGLSRRLRVSELKTELRSLQVNPVRLVWRGGRGFAFIHFQTVDSAKEAIGALSGRELDGREIKVEMANNDRPRRRGDYRGGSRDNPSSDNVESGDR